MQYKLYVRWGKNQHGVPDGLNTVEIFQGSKKIHHYEFLNCEETDDNRLYGYVRGFVDALAIMEADIHMPACVAGGVIRKDIED
ncbi:MAG: hypothetical protein Q7R83_04290 [bacterium]|nr:hypothetical protein [bacterium]